MEKRKHTEVLFQSGMAEFMGRHYGKSIDILSEVLGSEPDHKLAIMSRGSAYLKEGRIDEAIADFDRAIALFPDYARAYHLRGLAQEKKGRRELARIDFDRAIELNPDYGAAYFSRATLFTTMGHLDSAQKDIEEVTHLKEQKMETFNNENNVWRTHHLRVGVLADDD